MDRVHHGTQFLPVGAREWCPTRRKMAIARASPDARELANCIERDVRVIGERLIGDGQDPLTVEACVGAHGNGTVRGHDPPCPSRGQRSSLTMSRISEKSPALTLTMVW